MKIFVDSEFYADIELYEYKKSFFVYSYFFSNLPNQFIRESDLFLFILCPIICSYILNKGD